MGRYGGFGKQEADGLKKIGISWLKQEGYLSGFRSGTIKWTHSFSNTESSVGIVVSISSSERYLRIYYTQTDNDNSSKRDFDYKIPITSTPCHFGGVRYWLTCPWYKSGIYCGRRVGVLYKAGDYFACRHCYDLTYASKNQGGIWKTIGTAISIPELEELESKVKRQFYAGKMTRRYQSLLKKKEKSFFQMALMAKGLKS